MISCPSRETNKESLGPLLLRVFQFIIHITVSLNEYGVIKYIKNILITDVPLVDEKKSGQFPSKLFAGPSGRAV